MFTNRLKMSCLVLYRLLWIIQNGDCATENTDGCTSFSIEHNIHSAMVVITQQNSSDINCFGMLACEHGITGLSVPYDLNSTCRHLITSASCLMQEKYQNMHVHTILLLLLLSVG